MLVIQQEPELDLKSCLLGFISNNNLSNTDSDYNTNTYTHTHTHTNISNQAAFLSKPKLPFLNQLSGLDINNESDNYEKPFLKSITTNSLNNSNVLLANKKIINLEEILEKKSNLKKVVINNNQDDNLTIGDTYIHQKNQLKKTFTEEKTLLKN